MVAVEGRAELVTLCEATEPIGTSVAKSTTCVRSGTVDLDFASFRLWLSFLWSLSLVLRFGFEGLAPRTES